MTTPNPDVYPVGLLADVKNHGWRKGWGRTWPHVRRHINDRDWRALRDEFNGYLAKPYSMPYGVTRCGSGWTKQRALRSLQRQYRKAGYR